MDNRSTEISEKLGWQANQDYPLIPVRFYGLLIRLLESNGYDVDYLIRKAGMSRKKLNKPQTLITWRQVKTIITGAYKQTRHPALGLYFGQQLTTSDLGPLGMLMNSAKTVEDSLKLMQKYFKAVAPHNWLQLETSNGEAIVRMHLLFSDKVPRRFIYEAWAAAWNFTTKLYIGATVPHKYVFSYPAPTYAEVYNDVLEAPVEFDSDVFEIRFLADALDNPLPRRIDDQVAKLAKKQCDKQMKIIGQYQSFIREVYTILSGNPKTLPSLEELSKLVGTAPRTLSRNLQIFGTSYKEVINSVRMGLAANYLKYTDLPVEQIAGILNYSDPSNFRRAFKKQTGNAPSFYRGRNNNRRIVTREELINKPDAPN